MTSAITETTVHCHNPNNIAVDKLLSFCIGLQLFIAQYHIWLADDTHAILVLVPGNALLNHIVTTFIFVCVAHEIHVVTSTLAAYIFLSKDKS